MRVLGIDLAWGEGNSTTAANETGVAALDRDGNVLDAGWVNPGVGHPVIGEPVVDEPEASCRW